MAPATDSSFSVRSDSVSEAPAPHIGMIFGIIIGALVVIGTATALLVWFFRRRRALDPPRRMQAERCVRKRLLQESTGRWGVQDDVKGGRFSVAVYTPNGKIEEIGRHTPLLSHREEKPPHEFRSVTSWGAAPPDMSGATTDLFGEPASQAPAPTIPVDPHRPRLHKLAIPPSPSHPSSSTVNTVRPRRDRRETKEEDITSLRTADSESMYSQPSAEDGPDCDVPGTPTQAQAEIRLNVEDAQPLCRGNTFVISRILKQRAERSPQPLSRAVSRIERQGSIQSYCGEEQHDVPAPSRSVKKKSKKQKRSVPRAPMAPVPERPRSPASSTSSRRTIRQNGTSLDPWEPSTPPAASSHVVLASPMPGSSSTVHIIRQFPIPPLAGPSVARTNAGADPHSEPSLRPAPVTSSWLDSPKTASSHTARSADGAGGGEGGEGSPMLRTMQLSRKGQLVTLPRHASMLPSVYPDAAHHHHHRNAFPGKVRRNTVQFEHEWRIPTPPLEMNGISSELYGLFTY